MRVAQKRATWAAHIRPSVWASRFLRWLVQPLLLVGGGLIVITWGAALIKIHAELAQAERMSVADAQNYALLFEQDVLRTASEIDRTIKYLRHSYERLEGVIDWPTLVKEGFTVNNRTVQIAIIDRSGGMITSTAMLRPEKRIDLSDREHFKVHVGSPRDELFISKPLLGRASNKWSIQFTRPFRGPDGGFSGVIVVSLDPDALVSNYGSLQAFTRGSFLLLGSDDIIRASAGDSRYQIGSAYRESERDVIALPNGDGTTIFRSKWDGETRIVGARRVGKLPLEVIVSAPETHLLNVRREAISYLAVAALITIGVIFGIGRALRRQRRRMSEITALAHHDMLTGLRNRFSYQTEVGNLFKLPSAKRTCALHLIDLDKFKGINDTYGHQVGDLLLQAVAQRLSRGVRAMDHVFRLGGDEFALLQFECTRHDQAAHVAERLCKLLGEPFLINGHELHIGCSIGIASGSDLLESADSMLQAADMALYLSKSEGRGTFRFYDRGMDEALARRRQLEVELEQAAERGELELHYQPKMAISGDPIICGFEALVRWRHPKNGMMPPLEFIQLAEETGAIVNIGIWVLLQACTDIKALDPEITVAVNCSAVQFARSDVSAAVKQVLIDTGLEPQRLEIEITETMLMQNDHRTLTQLEAIRRLGVRISLDDFGTGYSSLSYLHTYPVDCIKIDRSFVKTIGTERDAGPIIRAIVAMACELSLTTVAEGVETAEQLAFLQLHGCTSVQGYLFSPPRPAAEAFSQLGCRAWPKAA